MPNFQEQFFYGTAPAYCFYYFLEYHNWQQSCCYLTHFWLMLPTLPKSCPNKEFFWSVFSRIWAEYGKIRTRKTVFGHFSHTAEKNKPYWKVKIVVNIVYIFYSAYIYLFKVNVGNTRTTCEIGFKLTIKTLERCKWRRLTSLLSTLNSFHPLFWYLHCWLWNRNYRLRYLLFVKTLPLILICWTKI